MRSEEQQKRLKEITTRTMQIEAETRLSFILRALAVGLASRVKGIFGAFGVPVRGLGVVVSAERDVKNLMTEFLALQDEKNALVNQTADTMSAIVTVPEVVFTIKVGNDSSTIVVPKTVVTAAPEDSAVPQGTVTITIPEVKVRVDTSVITIPEVVILSEPTGNGPLSR
jgi:hypothetical protein